MYFFRILLLVFLFFVSPFCVQYVDADFADHHRHIEALQISHVIFSHQFFFSLCIVVLLACFSLLVTNNVFLFIFSASFFFSSRDSQDHQPNTTDNVLFHLKILSYYIFFFFCSHFLYSSNQPTKNILFFDELRKLLMESITYNNKFFL